MRIQLSDHFTTGKLLRFVAPSIVMMIFTSVYGVVDGLFVSNFVGKTAFAAVNLIFPLLMILGALGFMIGTGGSALVARTLGEGDSGRAQRYFSMLVYVTIGGGIVFSVLGLLVRRRRACWSSCGMPENARSSMAATGAAFSSTSLRPSGVRQMCMSLPRPG